MNEELKNKASEVLLKMLDMAQSAGEFAVDKAPEIIQQLLIWEFWSSLLFGILFLVLTLLNAWLSKKIFDSDVEPVCIITITAVIIFFICSLYNLSTALKVYIAPDLYLLEYAAKLAQGY